MHDSDRRIRNTTYRLFVELGRAPEPDEIAEADGESVPVIEASWRRLHDAHALVLDERGLIGMANPFSAVPTPYRVHAADREWFANCAWDAVGICAALHVDGDIETACPHCGDPITVSIRDARASDESLLFHCLVPAASWWDDIAFT